MREGSGGVRKAWVENEKGQKQDSPEGEAVALTLHPGEVWLAGGGDELAAGPPGTLGGNECASAASPSNGSGRGEERRRTF